MLELGASPGGYAHSTNLDTLQFVEELFLKYGKKPRAEPFTPVIPTAPISPTYSPSDGVLPIQAYEPLREPDQQSNLSHQSRKRPFIELNGFGPGQLYNGSARPTKTAKARRGGREEHYMSKKTHGPANVKPLAFQQPFNNMPRPPTPPPGFPGIDPTDPMSSFLAMQAMFPAMATMPSSSLAGHRGSFGQLPPTRIKERCRDYDTQGFCVLGSSCPYDHGNDHIVAVGESDEYDPTNAIINTNGFNNTPRGRQSGDFGRGKGRARGRISGSGDRYGNTSRAPNKAPFLDHRYSEDQNCSTIVVEQIPEDHFEEKAVRDFFSQFGRITEITMKAYKNLAVVRYETHGSARRAWESPKVIFDNRFVKVYWYRPDLENSINGSSEKSKKIIRGLHSRSPDTTMADAPPDSEDMKRQQEEKQKAYVERRQALQKMEEAKQQLRRQKEEMAKKYDAEKGDLLAKIVAKQGSKPLQSASSPVHDQATNDVAGASNGQTGKSKVMQALETQLAQLQAEAKSMGIDPSAPPEDTTYYSYRGRGRGRGYVPRGGHAGRGGLSYGAYDSPRGGYRGSTFMRGRDPAVRKLDNRPRRVAISGQHFDAQKIETLNLYLMNVVEYEGVESDPGKPESVVVNFRERWQAEYLMSSKTDIPGVGKVVLSWTTNAPVSIDDETIPEVSEGKEQAHEEAHPELQEENLDVAEDDGWGGIT